MTAPGPLPWVPGAVRAYLLEDSAFSSACGGRCSTRAPSNVTGPFSTVRMAGPGGVQGDGVAFWPMILIEGWAAPSDEIDPEMAAWKIATAAIPVISRARNVAYQNMTWKGRVINAVLTDVDRSRGTDSPLYRAFIRAELTIHVR